MLFACGCSLALPAAVAKESIEPNNAKFISLDTNHDGYLSKDEVRNIPGYEKPFEQADENHDGRLSPSEFLKAESLYDRARAATYADDSVTTAMVKAALLEAPGVESLDVSVKTYKGEVLLSGFVKSEKQRDRAIQVASSVKGVESVKDGLVVR